MAIFHLRRHRRQLSERLHRADSEGRVDRQAAFTPSFLLGANPFLRWHSIDQPSDIARQSFLWRLFKRVLVVASIAS